MYICQVRKAFEFNCLNSTCVYDIQFEDGGQEWKDWVGMRRVLAPVYIDSLRKKERKENSSDLGYKGEQKSITSHSDFWPQDLESKP